MPPKKSNTPATTGNGNGDTTTSATADGPTKFIWEGPTDYKLLLLTQGRYVKPEEYEELASAFTGDKSTGSIRNRISKLRVLQRDLYADLNWDLPEGGSGHRTKKANGTETPKKRAVGGAEEGEGTPSKKARGKKGGVKKEDEDVVEGEGVVKEEVVEEETVEEEA